MIEGMTKIVNRSNRDNVQGNLTIKNRARDNALFQDLIKAQIVHI